MIVGATTGGVLAAQTVIISVLLSAGALAYVLSRLKRTRPDFTVGIPLVAGFFIRLMAIAGVASTGLQASLRGGDETLFLFYARNLSESPLGLGFLPHQPIYPLHTVVFGVQLKFGDFSDGALRVTQVGLAMMGILLIVAAVHDLAGGRAAKILAWVLMLEPGSIFFNSALHKEPLMVFAAGLVVFGGTKVWQRLDYTGILLMGVGGLVAVQTRPYAGWFLVSAGVLVILHASLRRLDAPLRAMPLIYAVVVAAFIAAPTLVQVTSNTSLTTLQLSQDANTDPDAKAASSFSNSNNLALERVNFSTRGSVFTNLPGRMIDVVFRPYPWQVANPSQQLGAAGTLFAMAGLILLLSALWKRRGHVLSDTGPILYPLMFLWMAYSLSAGNAGTGFRYRTHLVTLGFAMMVVLRERRSSTVAADLSLTSSSTAAGTAPSPTTSAGEWVSHAPRSA